MNRAIFLFFLLCLLSNSAPAQIALHKIIVPGSKLIYGVRSAGKEYDFIVTLKSLNGAKGFDWVMTAPINKEGTIVHHPKALVSAHEMHNYFQSGTINLQENALSVWLSSEVFGHFIAYPLRGVNLRVIGSKEIDLIFYRDAKKENLEILVNGKAETVQVYTARSKSAQEPAGLEGYFSFYCDAVLPIILRMNLGFYIALKEVRI